MANLFDLQTKIGLDTSDYESGMKTAQKSMNDYKSDVMKLAQSYKKSGMAMSDAMKKAYSEIDKSQYKSSNDSEGTSRKFSHNWIGAIKSVNSATERFSAWTVARGQLIADGIKASAKALFNFGKQAIDSYAQYEQLVGGVETLFGSNADQVQEYAKNAYKTAGLSANEYMEQATSFSASLVQSLGGDTTQAAEYAHKAIVDMADNANKMGTSMESIQNAYQGFAKGNWTMLDNLKLGYGGTAREMARLVNESGVLGDVQIDLNKTKDLGKALNDVGFSKIIEAIDVMQKKMGISGITAEEAAELVKSGAMTEEEAFQLMGTTAKEAAGTISGSIGATGAAWQNLVTGLADDQADFDTLIQNFVDSASNSINNLLPRFEIAFNGVASLIEKVFPIIMNALPRIINGTLPKIATSAANVMKTLVQGISQNKHEIAQTAIEIMHLLITTIVSLLPDIISTGADLIIEFLNAIAENPDQVIETAIQIIENLVIGLLQAIPKIVEAAAKAIAALIKGLWDHKGEIADVGAKLLNALADAIMNSLGAIVEAGKGIIGSIKEGISAKWGELTGWFEEKWDGLFGNRHVNVDVGYGGGGGGGGRPSGGGGPRKPGGPTYGKYASGLDYVPFDGFLASLHKGERILTREEANAYTGGGVNLGGVTINISGAQYQDPQSLAEAISEELQKLTTRREAVYA